MNKALKQQQAKDRYQSYKIALRFEECRKSVEIMAQFQKKEYKELVKDYKDIIQAVMKKENLEPLNALIFISEMNAYQDSGMAQLLFIAAAADLVEEKMKTENLNPENV